MRSYPKKSHFYVNEFMHNLCKTLLGLIFIPKTSPDLCDFSLDNTQIKLELSADYPDTFLAYLPLLRGLSGLFPFPDYDYDYSLYHSY